VKLTSSQLVKIFPAVYVTRRFITTLTAVCYLSLSPARVIQSMPSHPISLSFILVLPSQLHPVLSSCLLPSGTTDPACIHFLPTVCHVPCPADSPWCEQLHDVCQAVQTIKLQCWTNWNSPLGVKAAGPLLPAVAAHWRRNSTKKNVSKMSIPLVGWSKSTMSVSSSRWHATFKRRFSDVVSPDTFVWRTWSKPKSSIKASICQQKAYFKNLLSD